MNMFKGVDKYDDYEMIGIVRYLRHGSNATLYLKSS